MVDSPPDKHTDPHLEEAFDWLIRLQESPNDAGLRRALEEWRNADVQHEWAWRRARRIWGLVGEAEPEPELWPSEPEPGEGTLTKRRRLGGRKAGVASAAVAACLLLVLWPLLSWPPNADYRTAVGETQRVHLEDDSVVYLGGRSAIDARYETGQRRVDLLAGQAFFDVRSNPERPFVVQAGDLDITVTGTAFDVEVSSNDYTVSVRHGSVRVHYDGPGGVSQQELGVGQQLRVARDDGAVKLRQIAPDHVAAWREGRLFVHDRSIADVVETLRRYHYGYILVPQEELASRRVTGSYNLREPAHALRGLVGPHNGRVHEFTPLMRILQAP